MVLAFLGFIPLASQTPESNLEFQVVPRAGLFVSIAGVPVIRGSFFQYYAPGWTRGYYSSRWTDQKVEQIDPNTIRLSFTGAGGDASGVAVYKRAGNTLKVTWDLNWTGADPAKVELTTGMSWVAPFRKGEVSLDGRSRMLPDIPPVGSEGQRQLGAEAKETKLSGSLLNLSLKSSEPARIFDARGYNQDWAEGQALYWQGFSGIDLVRGVTKHIEYEYKFDLKARVPESSRKILLPPIQIQNGVKPDEAILPLIPKPKASILDYEHPVEITNSWHFPAGRFKFFDKYKELLEQRFELPKAGSLEGRISIDGGMSKLQKLPGSYRLQIKGSAISVIGEEPEGLLNGIYRLAQLTFIRNGKLMIPSGIIEDEPRSDFRGVHLFVGKQALPFQQKLWNQVLRPLGLNKVVLQCERTEWKALPGVEGMNTMPQKDLVKLFNWYRDTGVEPIPLIQSFGHMEWFFGNGKNLEFAMDAQNPYAIDPRKEGSQKLLKDVWEEAIRVLKPKTVHFGLDEVDMRGFPKDPKLVTELWKLQLPFLGQIASKNKVDMMLWGDKALAPGEGVDATLGDSKQEALERRAAIPKGAFIADWHYKAEQDHKPFLKSLQTWKVDGFRPIASTWYRPENIRGFGVASDLEGAGMLQTTWAGYESNEANMFRELKQFTAMVLAADYAWSGRLDRIEELDYNPAEVFARLYNPVQSPLTTEKAVSLGRGAEFTVAGVGFTMLEGMSLPGISPENFNASQVITFDLKSKARQICLALKTDTVCEFGELVANAEIVYASGEKEMIPLRYGLHVRADEDSEPTFCGRREKGRTCLRLPLKNSAVASLSLQSVSNSAGLKLDGVTLLSVKGTPTPTTSGRSL